MTPNPKQPHKLAGRHWQQKPALTQIIEIIGDRSDGCSRYALHAPLAAVARQNGASHG